MRLQSEIVMVIAASDEITKVIEDYRADGWEIDSTAKRDDKEILIVFSRRYSEPVATE